MALGEFGGNPVQLTILLACAQKETSATDVAPDREAVAAIAYHFRVLAERRLIRFSRSEQRRGATAKFYVATPRGSRLLGKLGVTADGNTTTEGNPQ